MSFPVPVPVPVVTTVHDPDDYPQWQVAEATRIAAQIGRALLIVCEPPRDA